jgi:hypothetical protein
MWCPAIEPGDPCVSCRGLDPRDHLAGSARMARSRRHPGGRLLGAVRPRADDAEDAVSGQFECAECTR